MEAGLEGKLGRAGVLGKVGDEVALLAVHLEHALVLQALDEGGPLGRLLVIDCEEHAVVAWLGLDPESELKKKKEEEEEGEEEGGV